MYHTYQILKQIFPALNERPLDEFDFYEVVNEKQIEVIELKLRRRGYYVWDGEDHIFIKKSLRQLQWLETAFHELCHALTCVHADFLYRKQEQEAYLFALVALIPKSKLENFEFLEENPTKYAYKLWQERQKVYFLYGV